jgi:predicted RNA-binding Zn ribbon-like protein
MTNRPTDWNATNSTLTEFLARTNTHEVVEKLRALSDILFRARIIGLVDAEEELQDMLTNATYTDQWLDEVADLIEALDTRVKILSEGLTS